MTVSETGQIHSRINSVEKEVASLSGEMVGLKNEVQGMRHDIRKFVDALQNSKSFSTNGNGKTLTWSVVSVLIMVFMILQIQIGFVWGISLRGYEELKEQMTYRDKNMITEVNREFDSIFDNQSRIRNWKDSWERKIPAWITKNETDVNNLKSILEKSTTDRYYGKMAERDFAIRDDRFDAIERRIENLEKQKLI